MLHPRYSNDGLSIVRLNRIQQKARTSVQNKVTAGVYEFEEVHCPICSRNEFEQISEKDRYGLYMPVVICKHCGLVQTNPRMNQSSYERFYNSDYRALYVGTEAVSSNYFEDQRVQGVKIYQFLASQGILKDAGEQFILEVGCGAGGILYEFRERGHPVLGLDLGKEYLQFGQQHYGLDLHLGDLKSVTLDRSPDIVIYSHVLEHVLDINEELSFIANLLAESGVLYIEVPGLKNLETSCNMDLLRYLQNAHTFHFTLQTLSNLLAIRGFDVLYGDEQIRSIAVRNPGAISPDFTSDYESVSLYLANVEKKRKVSWCNPWIVKRRIRNVILSLLNSTRLLKPIRGIYYRLQKL